MVQIREKGEEGRDRKPAKKVEYAALAERRRKGAKD